MITQELLDKAKNELEAKAQDFAERVAPFYRVMRWGWNHGEVPTVDDIYMTVMTLINTLEPNSKGTAVDASTGGIDVSVVLHPGSSTVIAQISFVPEFARASFRAE